VDRKLVGPASRRDLQRADLPENPIFPSKSLPTSSSTTFLVSGSHMESNAQPRRRIQYEEGVELNGIEEHWGELCNAKVSNPVQWPSGQQLLFSSSLVEDTNIT